MPIWRPIVAALLALAALITTAPAADASDWLRRAAPPVDAPAAPDGRDWILSWQEEFNAPLDKGRWSLRGDFYTTGRTHAKADWSAVRVADGKLSLRVLDDPARGPGYWLTGHIGTEFSARWSDRPAYFEASIKFQPLNGSHGAFWTLTPIAPGSPGDSLPETDIAEYFGVAKPWLDDPTRMDHHLYWRAADGSTAGVHGSTMGSAGVPWSREFHQFGALRTQSGCWQFYIDDRYVEQLCSPLEVEPKYLVLSLLVKDFELDKVQADKLSQYVMKVDWVRVWI